VCVEGKVEWWCLIIEQFERKKIVSKRRKNFEEGSLNLSGHERRKHVKATGMKFGNKK